jgi:two-component system nitrate/nitrite response regulator NarL
MRSNIRVLIAIEVRLYREGIAHLLRQCADIEVVDTVGSGRELFDRLAELSPDVVLLDTGLPEGVQTVRSLLRQHPGLRIVALGLGDTEPEVLSYAEAGMSGYCTREGSADELLASIRAAADGGFICSPQVAALLLRSLASARPAPSPAAVEGLTRRERQVMELIARDLSNKQIASALHIEVSTVKIHVHHILEKLRVSRRALAASRMYIQDTTKPSSSARDATVRI